MNRLSSRLVRPGLALILTFGLTLIFYVPPGVAQTSNKNNSELMRWVVKKSGHVNAFEKSQSVDATTLTDRVIDDMIPLHVPIRLDFQNLDPENLLDHISVRVTNLSKKPIYYLKLSIGSP